MTTYYEILKVQTTASVSEIESAFETQYNQWRRLVTHHDPSVVAQANQALITLEQVRTTLTDPAKRSAYDAGIGMRGAVGGIADPEAVLRAAMPPPFTQPPTKAVPAGQPGAVQRVDAWICPKCHTANSIGTGFCKQCGQALSRNCPNCNYMVEASAQFCPACGKSIEEALREREMEEQRQAILQRQEAERLASIGPMRKISTDAWKYTKIGCVLAFIPWAVIASVPLWIYSAIKAREVLNSNLLTDDIETREMANKAYRWSVLPLAIVVSGVVIYLCTLVFNQ